MSRNMPEPIHCSCDDRTCSICEYVSRLHRAAKRPERTQGKGSGYVRGMPFWTHVTTSYGRETR